MGYQDGLGLCVSLGGGMHIFIGKHYRSEQISELEKRVGHVIDFAKGGTLWVFN